ncbi:MAG: DUF177 domain-containing protein, partial [Bacteroidota bacterium]
DFWLTDRNELLDNESEDVFRFSQNEDVIDLSSSFRELILIEEQIKNICKDDCKGLCSNCGENLNEGTCGCSTEIKDNTWDALKNLKDKIE